MKYIFFTLSFLVICHLSSYTQVADGINYQAIALDETGNPVAGTDENWNVIPDKQFDVRFSVLGGSSAGAVLYQETHLAHTDPYGMFSLVVGHGESTAAGEHGRLADIPWGADKLFLRVEIDLERSGNWRTMDNQQMMAVPFAFHALSAGAVSNITAQEGHDPDEPIFSVTNSKGDTVFAVYESGVVINIDDDPGKGTRGGFAVGGFSRSKDDGYIEYLRVDPGHVRINIDDDPDSKGTRGGFAVGGFSSHKAEGVPDYFFLDGTSALFQLDADDIAKGTRGGFAVGGFSRSKSGLFDDYLVVRPDSVRIYIDDDANKGTRGGFAVGGFSSRKQGDVYEFLRIDPGYVRVGIYDDPLLKGTRAGFAVGGFSSQKGDDMPDYLHILPGSAEFLLDEDASKGTRGGFAVGGFSSQKADEGIFDFMTLEADSARIYIEDNEGRGGFAVVERTDNKGGSHDVLYVAPDRTSVYLKDNTKNSPDGFAVFNREDDHAARLFSVSEDGTFVSTLFEAVPVLYTNLVSAGVVSATIQGLVLNTGGADITEYGFVYSTQPNPTTAVNEGIVTETGVLQAGETFTLDITELAPETTYYVRAWARNRTGTGYGQQVEYTTLPDNGL